MPQRRKILGIAKRVGLVTFSFLLAFAPSVSVAQVRPWDHGSLEATEAEHLPVEPIAVDWRVPQFETNSVIAATLCFAVGFGACLLVVHSMLPSLVHAQCIEIVREYMDHTKRESDIRVVVLDRGSHEPLQQPRRVRVPAAKSIAETSFESQHHLRVDKPAAPAGYAPVGPPNRHSDDAPSSMLSQIYEQNLHLRDQMRKQSRSVKQ